MEWVIELPVLFFSVAVHEFCHGWVAFARGDDTAERAGRLTFNPLSHIDAFGTVFVPMLCFLMHGPMFGWARPIPVDSSRLKEPVRDIVRVAMVGPLANFLLALAAAVTYKLVSVVSVFAPAFQETVLSVFRFAVLINLFLAFFNLIPVFPLDGSRVLAGVLPPGLRRLYNRHVPYGSFIILCLLFTKGISSLLLLPMRLAMLALVKIGLVGYG